MAEEFDAVMELMEIREGMLEEDRHGPAEIVRLVISAVRALEADNMWLRVRIAELAAGRPRRSSDVRPEHRPTHRPPAVRSSSAAPGRPSDERRTNASDGRPPSRASELQLLSDQEDAAKKQGKRSESETLRPNAAAARADANGRTSDEHADEQSDEGADDWSDRVADEDPDGALRAQMAAAWDGVGGAHTSGNYKLRMGGLIPLLRKLAGEQGKEPTALWGEAVARFKRDPEARRKRLGLPVLIAQFERWTYDDDEPPPPPNKSLHLQDLPPVPGLGAERGQA